MTFVKHTLFALPLALLVTSCASGGSSSELGLGRGAETEEGRGEGEEPQDGCAFTQGYWKNHPEAWPLESISLGEVSYTKQQLLDIFHQPVMGNGLISLSHQLIAAKLNVANGAEEAEIDDEIAAADALIGSLVCPPVGSGTSSTSATSALTTALDVYNNTAVCEGDGDGPVCGNGVVEEGEQCDDGNTNDNDGCRNDCTTHCPPEPVCGNGIIEEGEECDDGNTTDGDGCSSECMHCGTQVPVCGNGVVEDGEECDDGNVIDGDGCSSTCRVFIE